MASACSKRPLALGPCHRGRFPPLHHYTHPRCKLFSPHVLFPLPGTLLTWLFPELVLSHPLGFKEKKKKKKDHLLREAFLDHPTKLSRLLSMMPSRFISFIALALASSLFVYCLLPRREASGYQRRRLSGSVWSPQSRAPGQNWIHGAFSPGCPS